MRYVGFSILWIAVTQLGLGYGQQANGDEPRRLETRVTSDVQSFVTTYCLDCHAESEPVGNLQLEPMLSSPLATQRGTWERVVRRLATRQMPPPDAPQPTDELRKAAENALTLSLDELWNAQPQLGSTPTFRRLTRIEYANAIRDLFDLSIDAESLLPADETSHGFDNITVTTLPPVLLQRYLTAAQSISRKVMGRPGLSPESHTFRVRPDVTQDVHLQGQPVGTRGGILESHFFPRSGDYELQVHLMRDRNEEVEGLREPHDLQLLVDREELANWTIQPPKSNDDQKNVDAHLKARVSVRAGTHQVAATFVQQDASLLETKRQPLHVHFNYYRHPRQGPAVYQLTVTGPLDSNASGPSSPTRVALLGDLPLKDLDEVSKARAILHRVMNRAYRRPLTELDDAGPLSVFRQAREDGEDFDAAIEASLAAVLVSPHFLFRVERTASPAPSGSASVISDLELASRLSFFLWSSLPDENLLQAAKQGQLRLPDMLQHQVVRMLADERSQSLVDNFAAQWLQLRNLEAATPDMRLFADFDDNLRQAMRKETESLFTSLMREDRSVLELFRSNETYLNQRLADHYGIPHIKGSHFRRVPLDTDFQRGGLLRHASLLTVTSYATRTSPVLRGKWVLENLLASPPPPPPPNVPALDETIVAAHLPVRQRLEQHRADAACAHCHRLIDPVGFCFEHYDAIGHWRDLEEGHAIDARGGLTGKQEGNGLAHLGQSLVDDPEPFVQAMTEKLFVFALGRTLESEEMAAIRKVVRNARTDKYRFSSIVLGIARSAPFQMRRVN